MRCGQIELFLLVAQKRLQGISLENALFNIGTIRWADTADKIIKLAAKRQFNLPASDQKFRKTIESAERTRNLLVHSAMRTGGGRLFVINLKRLPSRGVAESKVTIDSAMLKSALNEMRACLRLLRQLERETRSLL